VADELADEEVVFGFGFSFFCGFGAKRISNIQTTFMV
jgi:hypothetical protein